MSVSRLQPAVPPSEHNIVSCAISTMTTISTSTDKSLPQRTLRLYSTTSLSTDHADLLPPLTALINFCYSVGHTSSPHGILLPYSAQRLSTHTSLIEEVGKDGFVLILTIPKPEGGQQPIASTSAKPFKELGHHESVQGNELVTNFKRRAAPPGVDHPQHPDSSGSGKAAVSSLGEDVALPRWEIICNAVHPDYQKQGLAAQLYDAMMKEIRSRESPREDHRVHLVITTMKEPNEVYYHKRGFVTTAEKRFEPGYGDSEVGFSVVEMEMIV